MKIIVRSCLLAMFTLFVSATLAGPVGQLKCPVDGGGMYFTGETVIIQGRIFYVMQCGQGHRWLSRTTR